MRDQLPQRKGTAMSNVSNPIDRRDFLRVAGAGAGAGLLGCTALGAQSTHTKSVAGIVTEYRKNSHADVILGKILDGWHQDGGRGPALRLASMYVDQFPTNDMARNLAKERDIPLCSSIDEAITLGGNQVAVDGVLSIGEHGDYPTNAKGQHLYPRRRFFEQITNCFARCNQIVPVFSDKHLGPVWEDARWMYDRAIEMQIPFMAGSSLPVSFRKPDAALPLGSQLDGCLAIGYSGLDVYGFHTLEFMQCFVERRRNAEQGVSWVQSVSGLELKRLIRQATIRTDLLNAALQVTPRSTDQDFLEFDPTEFTIFVIHYADGLTVPVLMLPGYARGISVAMQVRGHALIASNVEERGEPYPHFAYLLKGIEQMIHTGIPAYPVERTLLTTGVLDRLLTSRMQGGARMETPELRIPYHAVDYGHAPYIDLQKIPG
jgi:hypothetical protein